LVRIIFGTGHVISKITEGLRGGVGGILSFLKLKASLLSRGGQRFGLLTEVSEAVAASLERAATTSSHVG
jgi:hypothetical protein